MSADDLTLAQLEDALRKIEETPHSLSEIRVQDAAEFIRLIGVQWLNRGDLFGVRIFESPYMPKHKGVMLDSKGNVMGIFDMEPRQ